MFNCLFLPTEITIIHRNLEASAVIQGLVKGTADLWLWNGVHFLSEYFSDFSYYSSLVLQTEVSLPV